VTPQLTINNAEIKTATVEIKTLTVSGKQVTLAVFRQLQEMPLIAEDGALNGVPWGTVNYHPDKCGADGEHRHVVWQSGADLRRSKVDSPATRILGEYFGPESADSFIQAVTCANGHMLPDWASRRALMSGTTATFRAEGINCISPAPIRHNGHDCLGGEVDELRERFRRDLLEEQKRRERYDTQWAAIGDLPQLFIAV